ncbi:formylmethanofuran dehydrogenase subunit A [Methanospirillum sp.]|uniref:formylmethanofuran dehydrogenase subunit A n=2 Tax=Methanospirillum sp. TaxID=45200 RepID=UPI001BD65CEC|nr:formylmethanofuran dehydrogenase subunit A [Methanospirillum sp.]
MSEILIKNGHVFDVVTGIKGDKADIAIKDGKIVDKVSSKAKTIDASGKTVMAGALDIHAHVAGPKVNLGRWFRPEDKMIRGEMRGGIVKETTRMEQGFSIPSVFRTGYSYARMGYGFAMEAAMPPLYARHVHEEIKDTPIVDEAALPVFGNNWFVFEYLKEHNIEKTAAYISWLLKVTKGYGIKVVNPGGTEAWGWGLNCLGINDEVPFFDITPGEITKGLIEANEYLGLPHSVHIHPNMLGDPGNAPTTIDTMKLAEGYKAKNKFGREQLLHMTHLQFHSYGGTGWGDFCSNAKEIMDYVNKHPEITFDTGNVTLDETTTMTADGPFEHHLSALNHLKWCNVDVELETGSGVVPFIYSPNVFPCAVQWAVGLELALLAKDPMRTMITTDHPNAGPFTRYPRVFKWLMCKKTRDEQMASFKHSGKVADATILNEIDRELTLYEISQMTRAGPAKALGLANMMGGLAPGMNADVAIYNLNPAKMPTDPEEIEKAFSLSAYFLKNGEIVCQDGQIVHSGTKKTFWVDAKAPESKQVNRDVREKFLRYYTVTQANYEVPDSYAPNPFVIEANANV